MRKLLTSIGKLSSLIYLKRKKENTNNGGCSSVFKGASKDDYVLPAAIYELGAIAWAECCNPPEGEEKEILEYRRKKMLECEEQINKVKVWEAYTLDARIGMRATSGLETLAWFKKKYGW